MSASTSKIAELNDLLRTTFLTGRAILTEGFYALPETVREDALSQVKTFTVFDKDNDPHGEHDFGAIDHERAGRIFWKIDYYDPDYHGHSENPADPKVTRRVLTVMLAEEY